MFYDESSETSWANLVFTKESILHQNSKTLEPDGPQHDCPAVCVIAQKYSSLTFVVLRFLSSEEHSGARLKVFLFQFLHFKNYFRLEFRQGVCVYVCVESVQCMHFLPRVRAFVLPFSFSFPWLLSQYLENVTYYNHHCVWF